MKGGVIKVGARIQPRGLAEISRG